MKPQQKIANILFAIQIVMIALELMNKINLPWYLLVMPVWIWLISPLVLMWLEKK